MNAVAEMIEPMQELRHDEPLARHTSWRVGGNADLFFRPGSVESLQSFLASLPGGTPVTWLGLGSNLLVRDGGVRGVVIATGALPKEFETDPTGRVCCSASLPCATLAKRAARAGIGPAAFFAGIPGSVGGALAMNAGAFGGETWDSVVSVTSVDGKGLLHTRGRDEYEIGYRSVSGPDQEWFLGAEFAFTADGSDNAAFIRSLLRERSDKQPLGLPSAGSVFRNPEGAFAGELVEQAGLKGYRRGGAMVAEKHANFIINTGSATAADIEALINEVVEKVLASTGVRLEPEVRIVGDAEARQ